MTIIENLPALLDSQKRVLVVDAYSRYPQVTVSDDEGAEQQVHYIRLHQDPIVETEQQRKEREFDEWVARDRRDEMLKED